MVAKPVLTDATAIRAVMLDANADDACVGVIAWMHTFSPAKMWISGLDQLRKPLLHLHTQANVELPWSDIDMDFMNLNQAAHGDREFGFVQTRLGLDRKTVAGHVSDPRTTARVGTWARAALGRAELSTMRLARFGDNMRNVAVTEGDKVEAELRCGVSVNTYGVNDLVEAVDAAADKEVDVLVEEYADLYDVAPELRAGGDRHESLRYGARIEVGLRAFLSDGGFTAFTTNFEDLGGLRQLPGLAVQRLMADGYGFGGEGDWKTSVMLRTLKVVADGLPGGTSFMEDYTYHLVPGQELILGAHMLEVCPSIAAGKPSLEIHPLGIGGREDPVRLVFDAAPGDAVILGTSDLGDRFRFVANEVEVVAPSEPLPNLPVARAVWRPAPDLQTSTESWLTAGGPHHTVLSTALTVRAPRRPRRHDGHRAGAHRRRHHGPPAPPGAALEPGLPPTRAGVLNVCAGKEKTDRESPCSVEQGSTNDMEKSVRRLIATVAGTALALSLAACGGSSDSGSGDKGTIGVAMPTKSSERWIADGNNIKKQLEAAGYKVDLQYAEDDIPTQVNQVENMVTKGEKMLVIAAIDGTALGDVLSTAKDSDIPVISYDRLIRDTDAVDYYATFDNEKVGEIQAQSLVDGLKASGAKAPYNVELFAGLARRQQRHVLLERRDEGPPADDRLRRHQGGVRPDQVRAGRHPALGPGHGAEAHGGHPHQELHPGDRQRRPLAVRRPVARHHRGAQVQRLLAAAARSCPSSPARTPRCSRSSRSSPGEQYSTVFKDTRDLAKVTVDMVKAIGADKKPEVNDTKTYDNGKKVVPSYLLDPVSVTKDNVQTALVDTGYYTADELK